MLKDISWDSYRMCYPCDFFNTVSVILVHKKRNIHPYVQIMQTIITFSLSVLISFLSSLFFNFPGASAMGREVWKMKSLPAHSAACRKVSAITEVRNIYKNYKGSCDSRTNIWAILLITLLMSRWFYQTHRLTVTWLCDSCPTEGAQITGQLQKSKFELICGKKSQKWQRIL